MVPNILLNSEPQNPKVEALSQKPQTQNAEDFSSPGDRPYGRCLNVTEEEMDFDQNQIPPGACAPRWTPSSGHPRNFLRFGLTALGCGA